jgi:hypothetical protein
MSDPLEGRCGTCARFVRVVETIADTGEVRHAGECLLAVWPSPLYETSTCSQWVRRGEFKARPPEARRRVARETPAMPRMRGRGGSDASTGPGRPATGDRRPAQDIRHATFEKEFDQMDAEEFRRVLSEVIRDELGVGEVDLAGKWEGGEMILKPGKAGVQEKRIPLDALFHKVIMIRERLRVLEAKINGNPKLADDDKVQLQQYVTACYGSLTTFNVLFANREDQFVGQKGDD